MPTLHVRRERPNSNSVKLTLKSRSSMQKSERKQMQRNIVVSRKQTQHLSKDSVKQMQESTSRRKRQKLLRLRQMQMFMLRRRKQPVLQP